jgi:hypothetical protein
MSLTTDRGWIATSRLLHYGIKGMRWGVRKSEGRPTAVTVTAKGKKLKTKGGENQPTAKDAARAKAIGQIKKKSGVRALSDADLQAYQSRMNLEQNVKRLEYNQANAGKKFILSLMGQAGKNAAQQAANEVASKQVKKLLVKGAVAAAV